MKNSKLVLFLFLFSSLGIYCKNAKEAKRHLHTDGFYLYDNGLDTIIYLPEANEAHWALIKLRQEEGLIAKDRKFTHEDSQAKSGEGTTEIECIAFYSDSTGTTFGTSYRKDTTIKWFLKEINYRKTRVDSNTMADNMVMFSDFKFLGDTTFTFTIGKGFHEVKEERTCTFSGNGLKVKSLRKGSPERFYVFVPYNNIPPDLLKVKKK
jgi:hypothetical protein